MQEFAMFNAVVCHKCKRGHALVYGGVFGSTEWSEEDKCWHGRILGIPDLITYEGKDYNILREEFVKAVDDWHKNRLATFSSQAERSEANSLWSVLLCWF